MKLHITADLHFRLHWFRWLIEQAPTYDLVCISADLLDMFKSETRTEHQTLREGRKVFKANVFERAWVFCVGAERVYNQVEFEFTLPEAAITAFVCNMPLQHRPVRGINTGVPPLVPKSDQSVQSPFPDPIASVDGPSANKSNGRGSLTTKRAAQLSGKNVDVRAIGRRREIHSVSGGPESGSFSTTVKAIHDLLERTRSLKTEPFRHQPEAI